MKAKERMAPNQLLLVLPSLSLFRSAIGRSAAGRASGCQIRRERRRRTQKMTPEAPRAKAAAAYRSHVVSGASGTDAGPFGGESTVTSIVSVTIRPSVSITVRVTV